MRNTNKFEKKRTLKEENFRREWQNRDRRRISARPLSLQRRERAKGGDSRSTNLSLLVEVLTVLYGDELTLAYAIRRFNRTFLVLANGKRKRITK